MSASDEITATGREPATVRVAMWSARHRWPVARLWFVATIGVFVFSLAMGGINAADANENPNERQLEASEAYDVFNAGGTNDPYEQFLVVVDGGPGADDRPGVQGGGRRPGRPAARRERPAQRRRRPRPSTSSRARSRRRRRPGSCRADGTTVRIVGPHLRRRRRGSRRSSPRSGRSSTRPARPTRTSTIHAISSTFINDDINELISTGPRRLAPADDPADVLHPAVRVRGDRRLGRAARPGDHLAAGGVRDPGHLQPGRRAGQPERDPADRAHRAGGRGRLLAVHDHPLPGRTAGRPRPGQGDRGLEQHRRPGGLLLRAGGDDLAGRADHPRRLAVHVDGDRDDLGRARLGHRQPDVPAGDAVDPRRPGQPRPAGDLAAVAGRAAAARAGQPLGPVGARLARPARSATGGQRVLGRARHRG